MVAVFAFASLALYYRSSLKELQNRIESLNVMQEVKTKYITEYIDREKVIYKDRIKTIKEYVYDQNKTDCQNAISVIRRTNI
jgi:hypothetical protein